MEYVFQILLANDEQLRNNTLNKFGEVEFDKANISNYNCVYYGQVKAGSFKDVPDILFYVFNMKHPKDYKHRSLSVGDIIIVNGMMYICCIIGFKEIKYDLVESYFVNQNKMFMVALQTGGIQGQPDIIYTDHRRVVAKDEKEATDIYNKAMKCDFFYGKCLFGISDDDYLNVELIK